MLNVMRPSKKRAKRMIGLQAYLVSQMPIIGMTRKYIISLNERLGIISFGPLLSPYRIIFQ